MKTTTIILSIINSLPLFLYVFVALPLTHIIKNGASFGEEGIIQFFGYGFAWAGIAYPLVLAFNHFNSIKNYRKNLHKAALMNQISMSVYLILLAVYGVVALGPTSA